VIIKISPDKQKSQALVKMAQITLDRLSETNTQKYPTNTLTDYYDIAHKLMEAILLKDGFKTSGEGAHKELIDFISEQHDLSEQNKIFLQQIRSYRNRTSYEGFCINKNYIIKNEIKIQEIIEKFFTILSRE